MRIYTGFSSRPPVPHTGFIPISRRRKSDPDHSPTTTPTSPLNAKGNNAKGTRRNRFLTRFSPDRKQNLGSFPSSISPPNNEAAEQLQNNTFSPTSAFEPVVGVRHANEKQSPVDTTTHPNERDLNNDQSPSSIQCGYGGSHSTQTRTTDDATPSSRSHFQNSEASNTTPNLVRQSDVVRLERLSFYEHEGGEEGEPNSPNARPSKRNVPSTTVDPFERRSDNSSLTSSSTISSASYNDRLDDMNTRSHSHSTHNRMHGRQEDHGSIHRISPPRRDRRNCSPPYNSKRMPNYRSSFHHSSALQYPQQQPNVPATYRHQERKEFQEKGGSQSRPRRATVTPSRPSPPVAGGDSNSVSSLSPPTSPANSQNYGSGARVSRGNGGGEQLFQVAQSEPGKPVVVSRGKLAGMTLATALRRRRDMADGHSPSSSGMMAPVGDVVSVGKLAGMTLQNALARRRDLADGRHPPEPSRDDTSGDHLEVADPLEASKPFVARSDGERQQPRQQQQGSSPRRTFVEALTIDTLAPTVTPIKAQRDNVQDCEQDCNIESRPEVVGAAFPSSPAFSADEFEWPSYPSSSARRRRNKLSASRGVQSSDEDFDARRMSWPATELGEDGFPDIDSRIETPSTEVSDRFFDDMMVDPVSSSFSEPECPNVDSSWSSSEAADDHNTCQNETQAATNNVGCAPYCTGVMGSVNHADRTADHPYSPPSPERSSASSDSICRSGSRDDHGTCQNESHEHGGVDHSQKGPTPSLRHEGAGNATSADIDNLDIEVPPVDTTVRPEAKCDDDIITCGDDPCLLSPGDEPTVGCADSNKPEYVPDNRVERDVASLIRRRVMTVRDRIQSGIDNEKEAASLPSSPPVRRVKSQKAGDDFMAVRANLRKVHGRSKDKQAIPERTQPSPQAEEPAVGCKEALQSPTRGVERFIHVSCALSVESSDNESAAECRQDRCRKPVKTVAKRATFEKEERDQPSPIAKCRSDIMDGCIEKSPVDVCRSGSRDEQKREEDHSDDIKLNSPPHIHLSCRKDEFSVADLITVERGSKEKREVNDEVLEEKKTLSSSACRQKETLPTSLEVHPEKIEARILSFRSIGLSKKGDTEIDERQPQHTHERKEEQSAQLETSEETLSPQRNIDSKKEQLELHTFKAPGCDVLNQVETHERNPVDSDKQLALKENGQKPVETHDRCRLDDVAQKPLQMQEPKSLYTNGRVPEKAMPLLTSQSKSASAALLLRLKEQKRAKKEVTKEHVSPSRDAPDETETEQSGECSDHPTEGVRSTGGRPALKDDPEYAKYFVMLKVGMPLLAVQHAMKRDGLDPTVMDGDHSKPADVKPSGIPLKEDPKFAKYFKMLKLGLPLGAVKQAMQRDGLDPCVLDGDHDAPVGDTDAPKEAVNPTPTKPRDTYRRTRLHWETLGDVRSNTVWELVDKDHDVKEIPIDENEFASLFQAELTPSENTSCGKSAGLRRGAVQVIDPKRANNGGIILARLKMSYDEMAKAVDRIDETAMSPEQLIGMHEYIPTPEEKNALKAYMAGPRQDSEEKFEALCECEKFMVALMTVRHPKRKINALLFKLQFSMSIRELVCDAQVVEKACEELRSSVRFRKILGIILNIGNRLNTAGPSQKGRVGAITLDSLLKLDRAKAFDKKTTILHYVVLVVQRHNESLLRFRDDLPSVFKADKIDWNQSLTEVEKIENQLENVRKMALHQAQHRAGRTRKCAAKNNGDSDSLSEVSTPLEEEVEVLRSTSVGMFTLDALMQVSSVLDKLETTKTKFAQLLEYFGEEGRKNMLPHHLFQIIVAFCNKFDVAREEVLASERFKTSNGRKRSTWDGSKQCLTGMSLQDAVDSVASHSSSKQKLFGDIRGKSRGKFLWRRRKQHV